MNKEVTGYEIREALKYWGLRRDAAQQAFSGSLHKFEGEEKPSPASVVFDFARAEDKISQLQVLQMRYNLFVEVRAYGQSMTLAEAIKRVGTAGKVAKMWATAGTPKHSYYRDETVREANQVVAKAILSTDEILQHSTDAARRCESLRTAIAIGNGQAVRLDFDPGLFPEED